MLPFHDERDTPEIRLMRTLVELNHRIFHTPSADERTALRSTITVLRAELVKLIEAMPIVSEEDVVRASTVHSLSPMLIGAGTPRGRVCVRRKADPTGAMPPGQAAPWPV